MACDVRELKHVPLFALLDDEGKTHSEGVTFGVPDVWSAIRRLTVFPWPGQSPSGAFTRWDLPDGLALLSYSDSVQKRIN